MAPQVDVIVEPTPNPNSYKFTLDRVVSEGGSQSFMNPEQAQASPLAQAIFAVEGVKSIFFLNNFITVSREPEVSWDAIVPQVEQAIRDHYAGD